MLSAVYRVAESNDSNYSMSVRGGHYKASLLADLGLNVLAPLHREIETVGGFDISSFPLARPVEQLILVDSDWIELGRELSGWGRYRPKDLEVLDIPRYATERTLWAIGSRDQSLVEAGQLCQDLIKRAERSYPYSELMEDAGIVHGDPHIGNMVKLKPLGRILFIDTDYVKVGPRLFDLAVSHLYQRRFNPSYPVGLIKSGYPAADIDEFALAAAACWKEVSSFTQLLTLWCRPGVRDEFFRRGRLGWEDQWTMVTGTPVDHPSFHGSSV
ncbi:phosphotransferase [Rhodococcus sp. 14-2483-1-2]|uniref:phosphotransferase n=1 Tax=Rhodococcus sp. 14-2483-1-2 TaxID=2023147 RepID=UPI001482C85D|nr:phosphotransferase [Rhodococcus sp. 14-2483-1-2]